MLTLNMKVLIVQLECGKWLLPRVEGDGDVPVLTLHGVGTDHGVLPSASSPNMDFQHFSTPSHLLCFDINKNSKEFGESSFGIYCI